MATEVFLGGFHLSFCLKGPTHLDLGNFLSVFWLPCGFSAAVGRIPPGPPPGEGARAVHKG